MGRKRPSSLGSSGFPLCARPDNSGLQNVPEIDLTDTRNAKRPALALAVRLAFETPYLAGRSSGMSQSVIALSTKPCKCSASPSS